MTYQVCNRCVMDNSSDDTITFDEKGNCNYCNEAYNNMNKIYFPNKIGEEKFKDMVSTLKEKGRGKKYDCIMGLSGGLDSSYLAYLGYKSGLRILGVHVDDGFNSTVAVDNIKKIANKCNIYLVMEKPDKEQFYNLTAAFIRAGVPNIAIPQDNLIIGYLYKCARENDIKYYLSGGNFALESILQRGNTYAALDKAHIIDINNRYGKKSINRLKIISSFERRISNKFLFRINEIRPLNYIEYNKNRAVDELNNFCGYNYYEGKHYESILTRFLQSYYLPKKFNFDKRKSHFSSLIITEQMTREEALEELKKPAYDHAYMEKDIEYLLERLDITKDEFNNIMSSAPHEHEEYKVSLWRYATKLNRKIRDLGNLKNQ